MDYLNAYEMFGSHLDPGIEMILCIFAGDCMLKHVKDFSQNYHVRVTLHCTCDVYFILL